MVHAIGYSSTPFNLADPGRLCRGRERWIEPWTPEDGTPDLHRLVITGASFSDDSAADALRGLPHSGFDVATVLTTVFGRRTLVAFMEDGHPADIPEGAEGVELYSGHRAGGRAEALLVRWFKTVNGVRELREVLGDDPVNDRVRGFLVLDKDEALDDALQDLVFLLVGMSTLDSPPARFQPAALPELLGRVRAVVLVHRDKHGPALGIYSREPLRAEPKLAALCEKDAALFVRFAIPPMLARWDRALAELRAEWSDHSDQPFPVPVSDRPSTWEPRRRRRKGPRERLAAEAASELPPEDAMPAGEDDGVDEDLVPSPDDDALFLTGDEPWLTAEEDDAPDAALRPEHDEDDDAPDDDDLEEAIDEAFEIDRDDAENWRDEDDEGEGDLLMDDEAGDDG